MVINRKNPTVYPPDPLPALPNDLHERRLHHRRSLLALLARQRSRDRQLHAGAHLNQLLPTEPLRARDHHALRECLLHDLLQEPLLELDVELWGITRLDRQRVRWLVGRDARHRRDLERRPTDLQMDDGAGGVRGDGDAVHAVEDGADCADVFLQGGENRGRVPENVDALRAGDREERGHGRGEYEGGAVNPLRHKTSILRYHRRLMERVPGD